LLDHSSSFGSSPCLSPAAADAPTVWALDVSYSFVQKTPGRHNTYLVEGIPEKATRPWPACLSVAASVVA
jgi:hypothetical protein